MLGYAPRKSNMSAEPPRSYPRTSFVEVPAIVDSEVDSFEMKNPPKSRTGAPVISAESLQQLVSQIERQWRRAQGTEE